MTLVTIYHNVAADPMGVPINFMGYEEGQPLVPVYRYTTLRLPSIGVLEKAFHTFNVGDDPDFGPVDLDAVAYRAAGNRSLSVGDVISMAVGELGLPKDTAWFTCGSFGWDNIAEPKWFARASQYGTTAMEREGR